MPMFRSLKEDAIRHLDTACTWRRVRAKEWVLDYRSGGTDLFFILRGHVRVVIAAGSGGHETILHDIRDSEFFGELAAIDGRPRTAGIVAVTDTLVARMSATIFRRMVHQYPDVCDQVLQTLVEQVRTLANRVDEQVGLTARQRLYAELLRLARAPMRDPGKPIVSPPPTHAELAARVNSHREAVTRKLGAMQRAGLIDRRRGAIVLLDLERLRCMITA